MNDGPIGRQENASVLAGFTRLARGDASGIMQFGHTPRAFLISLIPLIVLPLVVGLVTLAQGFVGRALGDLAAAVCVLLLPPVISHLLALRWNREEHWLRFAVAFNWSQLGLSILCMALLIALGIVFGAIGAQPQSGGVMVAVALLCVGLVGYGLWLHWFVARCGLGVTGGRAALLVLATYGGTFVLLVVRGTLLMGSG